MNQLLVGRKDEMKMLKEYFHSDRSEFIAVYGRRRVGKTYLIRKAAEDNFSFFVTGVHGASKSEQLINSNCMAVSSLMSFCIDLYGNFRI